MGELHLEILRERMQRDFGLKVRVHKPRVSYRETVRKSVEAEGEFHRQVRRDVVQFAQRQAPARTVCGAEADHASSTSSSREPCPPNSTDGAASKSVVDEAQGGGVVGYPLMKVKLTILDVGLSRRGNDRRRPFRAAAPMLSGKSLNDAQSVLLEPIMKLEVVTPEEFLGNIQADLNARRAVIVNSERRGDLCVLEAARVFVADVRLFDAGPQPCRRAGRRTRWSR